MLKKGYNIMYSTGIRSLKLNVIRCTRFYSSSKTHYDTLELPTTSTIKQVKLQFKKLSKKYHPDLNSHLKDEEKESNNSKFVEIVAAYEVLKDIRKKREYDSNLRSEGLGGTKAMKRSNEWHNKYYGEAKYHSRSGNHYTASGLNTRRHKVRYNTPHEDKSRFGGQHVNYGDRYDVPHFDYNEHLNKHLKFEQRIINKQLTKEERQKILHQLAKDGDTSNLSEELITKHLKRQVQHTNGNPSNREKTNYSSTYSPYIYKPPTDDESGALKTFIILGSVSGSLYLLYSVFSG